MPSTAVEAWLQLQDKIQAPEGLFCKISLLNFASPEYQMIKSQRIGLKPVEMNITKIKIAQK